MLVFKIPQKPTQTPCRHRASSRLDKILQTYSASFNQVCILDIDFVEPQPIMLMLFRLKPHIYVQLSWAHSLVIGEEASVSGTPYVTDSAASSSVGLKIVWFNMMYSKLSLCLCQKMFYEYFVEQNFMCSIKGPLCQMIVFCPNGRRVNGRMNM